MTRLNYKKKFLANNMNEEKVCSSYCLYFYLIIVGFCWVNFQSNGRLDVLVEKAPLDSAIKKKNLNSLDGTKDPDSVIKKKSSNSLTEKKEPKPITQYLTIAIISILCCGLLGYFGYKHYQKWKIEQDLIAADRTLLSNLDTNQTLLNLQFIMKPTMVHDILASYQAYEDLFFQSAKSFLFNEARHRQLKLKFAKDSEFFNKQNDPSIKDFCTLTLKYVELLEQNNKNLENKNPAKDENNSDNLFLIFLFFKLYQASNNMYIMLIKPRFAEGKNLQLYSNNNCYMFIKYLELYKGNDVKNLQSLYGQCLAVFKQINDLENERMLLGYNESQLEFTNSIHYEQRKNQYENNSLCSASQKYSNLFKKIHERKLAQLAPKI